MPTPSTAKWPKPRSEDEFEDIAVDFLRIRWKDPHVTRNGRRGQRQDGVDIVGRPPWLAGKTAGAQCKNSDAVKLADVVAEAKKAVTFKGGLGEFLLITSGERDAALQAAVREHFKAHPTAFHVEVIFWQDVTADLCENPELVAKHWKGFGGDASQRDGIRSQLSVIRMEAQRMKEHAESLNAGLYNLHSDSLQQYLPLRFRPAALNNAYANVASSLTQQVLLSSLATLQGAAAAADSETDRIIDGRTRDLEELRRLVLLAYHNAHHVVREIDQLLARQQ